MMKRAKRILVLSLAMILAFGLWYTVPAAAEEGIPEITEESVLAEEQAASEETADLPAEEEAVPEEAAFEEEISDPEEEVLPVDGEALPAEDPEIVSLPEGNVGEEGDFNPFEYEWGIDLGGLTINGRYFENYQSLAMPGDEIIAHPAFYCEEELFDDSQEGYSVAYELSNDEGESVPVNVNEDGSASFTAPAAGEWYLGIRLNYGEEEVYGVSYVLEIREPVEKPENYTVAFERSMGSYGDFGDVAIKKYYIDIDGYSINAYPVLYVDGVKVESEWADQPAYFSYQFQSSDESVLSIDQWGYTEIAGPGTATLTADIFYTPDRDNCEPYYLDSAELQVTVTDYELQTKEAGYDNSIMYVVGETAVITPVIYTDVYEGDQWVKTNVDLQDITFQYQIDGLTEEQYTVSEDTHTLTIPDIPEGQFLVTLTALKEGAEILEDIFYVCGAPVPSLDLQTRFYNGEVFLTNWDTYGNTIFADGVGYDWGEVKFEYLDPDTKKAVKWIVGQSIAGGGSPNNSFTAHKSGQFVVRASLYRDTMDMETPLVTEEKTITAYASFNKTVIDLIKGKSFTVKPSSKLTEAGLTVKEYTSSDTSVFTVSSSGVVKAQAGGAATLKITCTTASGYDTSFSIPVNVYEIKFAETSFTYTGKAIVPTITVIGPKYSYKRTSEYKEVYDYVVSKTRTKYAQTDLKLSYSDNKNAGTATITITPKNGYCKNTALTKTFTIKKAANSITKVTASKTLKYSTLKTKSLSFTIAATVKGGAKKTFKLTSVPTAAKKYITVSSSGKVTVKKGLAKGTYKIKVKITAAATSNYNAKSATKTITIKVS